MRHKLILASICLASCGNVSALTLPSFTPYKIEIRQGNLITADMREKVKVGMTTSRVRAALGTPLLIDPFHPNRWDYQYRYEQEGKLIRQQRLTLYFENDLLARIDEHDMAQDAAAPKTKTSSQPAAAIPVVSGAADTPAGIEAAPQAAEPKAEPESAAAPQPAPEPEHMPKPAPAPQTEVMPAAAKAESTAETPVAAEEAPQEAAKGRGTGQENNPEHKKMVEEYREGAEQGNAEAQFNLGRMYDFGYGVQQNFKVAAEWYRKASKQGYAQAFYNLALMNDLGRGVRKDSKKAATRYREAADLGDAKAQYALGMMYAKGRGVPHDDKLAMTWFRKAAEQGHDEAVALVKAAPEPAAQAIAAAPAKVEETVPAPMVASAADQTEKEKQDQKKIAEAYRKEAEQGSAEAQYNMGQLYNFGLGVPRDYKVAAEWYRKAGKQGYAKAFYNLGLMNELGHGVIKNEVKAAARYREAAELGDARSQYTLGLMYAEGRGVKQDNKEAMSWYGKAAAQGYADAIARINAELVPVAAQPAPVVVQAAPPAVVEAAPIAVAKAAPRAEEGKATSADQENNPEYKKMAEAYRKGAEQKDAEAQFNLGQMYELGYGVPQDYKVAAEWYRKAGMQKYAQAFFNLGVMNEVGRGVPKDDKKAAARYQQAAELGDAKAQYTLGLMYAKGRGVDQDARVAMYWYRRAAEHGHAEAQAAVKAAPVPEVEAVAAAPAQHEATTQAVAAKAETAPMEVVQATAKEEVDVSKARSAQKPEQAPRVKAVASAPLALSAEAEQAIAEAVKNWAAAWSSQDMAKYLASYAPTFKPADGASRAKWEAQRKERVAKPKYISVELSDMRVGAQGENRASVHFRQSYRADKYGDVSDKALELKKTGDKWLIVSEHAGKVAVLPQVVAAKAEAAPKIEAAAKTEPAHKAEPVPKASPAASATRTLSAEAEQAIIEAVKSWAAAWSAKDVEKYLASYAQAFKPADGMSRTKWEAQRRERVTKPKSIVVELSGITANEADESSANVSFKQSYRADTYKDVTNKMLVLKKINDKWLIMSEQVGKK